VTLVYFILNRRKKMKYIFHVRVDKGLDNDQINEHLRNFRDDVDSKEFFENYDKVLYVSDEKQTWIETVPSDFK